MVTISRYTYLLDAQFAQIELANNEIRSFIADEHTATLQWLYTNAIGGIRLQVDTEDEIRASEILHAFKNKENEFIKCPHCESKNTYRMKLSPWAFATYLLGVFLPLKSGRLICQDCGENSSLKQASLSSETNKKT